ncbi:N-6 DNA methylase [Streptomyces sp. NPDC058751]|uniref:N-6 DNA methylase n=1 Tax=Streptomyces sp. NPDC058751 TaxID=3346623 RepID=UPI0036BA5C73
MGDFAEMRVSRSDIARMAGVKRPAVTNWERRHLGFPDPVGGGDLDVFRADQVLEWLSGRTIPANALEPGEPTGATYGDRFRAALGGGRRSGGLLTAVEQLAVRDAERLRGPWRMSGYLYLLLFLVFVQSQDPERWSAYVENPGQAPRDLDFGEMSGQSQVSHLVRFLDRSPPASRGESRQAFDRLLTLFQDSDARASDEYFTPPSVSRVMAGALAGSGFAASRLHDPFCRTGELLGAYLDAVAEQGRKAPTGVSGRALGEGAQRLARMNLELHGAERPLVLLGPRLPSMPFDGDLSGRFDAVITNPPFGAVGARQAPPPHYWRYGTPRSQEFDWLQYVVSCLDAEGRAAVLMPAGAGFRGSADRETRARLVEDGVVECVMALPTHLFELTSIQTHVWFLRAPRGRPAGVLFVDGADLGGMATRTRRALSDADVDRLVRAYTSWRGTGHGGQPGLSRAVDPQEIAAQDHRLEPALYVREPLPSADAFQDRTAARNRLAQLSAQLRELHVEAEAVDGLAEERLRRYGL